MNQEQAVELVLAIFREAYQSKFTIGPATATTWIGLLRDARAEEILDAGQRWARSNEWPPTPAQLLDSVPRLSKTGPGWRAPHSTTQPLELPAGARSGRLYDPGPRRFGESTREAHLRINRGTREAFAQLGATLAVETLDAIHANILRGADPVQALVDYPARAANDDTLF